ncbi:MAG: response regulator [Pseudomonadota bacterium]
MPDKKPTVLLVEDDAADQEILRRAVSEGVLRADLRIVSDGADALAYLSQEGGYASRENAPKPDLVLLDLNMPGLSGHEVLARLRAKSETRTLPVVVLTTSDSDQDIVKSYELGANSYITKPVNFQDFVRVVRELDEYWFDYVALPPADAV